MLHGSATVPLLPLNRSTESEKVSIRTYAKDSKIDEIRNSRIPKPFHSPPLKNRSTELDKQFCTPCQKAADLFASSSKKNPPKVLTSSNVCEGSKKNEAKMRRDGRSATKEESCQHEATPFSFPRRLRSTPPVFIRSVPNFNGNLSDEEVKCDEQGRPVIIRHAHLSRTTVWKDDGSKRTFGKNTLESLLSSSRADTSKWFESLSNVELHGLVHEIGQQLIETSHLYHYHESKLECLAVNDGREYFGLTETSTLKDLDIAYKRMAKQMHPDKNGGTEAAKQQFQQLSERYTGLKKTFGKGGSATVPSSSAVSSSSSKPAESASSSFYYEPTDRNSLIGTALSILNRMASIQKAASYKQQASPTAGGSSKVRVVSKSPTRHRRSSEFEFGID